MNDQTYWYLALALASIALLMYISVKTKDVRSFWLFLAIVGLGYTIEAVIYFFGGSYQYDPAIIKYDSYFDSNLGAVVSNTLSLPVSATFIAVFRLNWKWVLFIIGTIVGIEWLFTTLQIYSHNWWRLEYTALGLPVYYLMAKLFYRHLLKPINKWLDALVLVLMTVAITGTLHFIPILFLASRYYHPNWFAYTARDTSAFAAVLYSAESLFYVFMAKLRWIKLWIKALISVAVIYAAQRILSLVGILESHVWWDSWYYLFVSIIVLWIIQRISNRLDMKRDSS
ncbi:hypothetical protein [Paenibacillus agricola]|uniref:Uncharacterized protein n=1 Tax=Paenibacillus agricola TaxID=2716264 RepID=A0ABX0IWG9_9BACL|nr:hypothetical protein [Paenibacillus agricola]NHN28252.1 hypothetical protein [Paenibacillus agricola]